MLANTNFHILGIVLVCLIAGCQRSPGPETQSATDVIVAEDKMGAITLADVDRYILDLPPGNRWQAQRDPQDWLAEIARRLAVDRLLVEEAELLGVDREPQFAELQRSIERSAAVRQYLAELPDIEVPSAAETRAFFEEHREERYERPERRVTHHIFKRTGPERGRSAVKSELEELRRRVLAGESFSQLARDKSDSESRHQDGLLGVVQTGQFSPDFDKVVFALDEGVPSEIVLTKDGAHLFFVKQILEARSFGFDEVKRAIYQELLEEKRRQRLERAASELPASTDRFVPGPDEIANILRLGDRSAVLLRLADYRLTVGGFSEALDNRRQDIGAKHVPDLPYRLFYEIRDSEIIYQHLLREGRAETNLDTASERRRQLVNLYARRKMVAHLESQGERIQRHYEGNSKRFSTPIKLGVTRFSVQLPEDPSAEMAELERVRKELDSGTLDFETLAARSGGAVEDLGVLTPAKLQGSDPKALRFAFQLAPGEHSPPYQHHGTLTMFRVDSRLPPEERPLSVVWDLVLEDYLSNYSARVFEEVSGELLQESGFRLYRDRLVSPSASAASYSSDA